jgi:hypothetical protein
LITSRFIVTFFTSVFGVRWKMCNSFRVDLVMLFLLVAVAVVVSFFCAVAYIERLYLDICVVWDIYLLGWLGWLRALGRIKELGD